MGEWGVRTEINGETPTPAPALCFALALTLASLAFWFTCVENQSGCEQSGLKNDL